MKQAFFVLKVVLALWALTGSAKGDTITWASGVSGNWSNPNNWSPAEVPGPSDTAIINTFGVYTVTLDTNTSVSGLVVGADVVNGEQTLLLSGQTFDINGPATVKTNGVINLGNGFLSFDPIGGDSVIYGALTCSTGGTLSGELTIASNGAVNLTGISAGTQAVDFADLTLTNYGTVNWSNIDLDCSYVAVFNCGLWDIQSDNTLNGDPFTALNNYGMVRKDGGDFSSPNYITVFGGEMAFNNSGTMDIEIGGINTYSGSGGGFFNTGTNAGLSLGNFTLTGDTTFSGPGQVQGTLFGSNGVIHGSMAFDYGSFSGTLTVATDGVVNLVGIRGETTPIGLDSLSLTNCGTVVWSNITIQCRSMQIENYGTIAWNDLDIQCQSPALIDNYGLWDIQSDNTFYGNSGGSGGLSTFNNYGTVRKDGGDFSEPNSYTTFDNYTMFNNHGTLDVETGMLELYTGSGGGVFNTSTNGSIGLGFFTLTGDVTFTGPSRVSGNPSGNNGIIHGDLDFYWGSFSGTLTVATNGTLNFLGSGASFGLNAFTLTNYGTVTWSNVDLNCSSAQIENYGLWDAQSDNTFSGSSGPYPSVFNNYGIVRKDVGSSITTFDNYTTFNNSGKTDVQIGQVALDGNCSLTNGTLNFAICSPTKFGSINFANYVQLAGRVSANLKNHYMPAISNSFPVILYGSPSGTFTSLCLPPLASGLGWQTNYTSTAFALSVVGASPLQLSSGLSLDGSSMSLSWDGLLGQTYQVQCTTNLVPAIWVNLGDPIAGTKGPISVLDSITNSPNKYYRIESQ